MVREGAAHFEERWLGAAGIGLVGEFWRAEGASAGGCG